MRFLLRQLRKKLLTENKVKNYLLYAIGEIFLVTVGILLAFQLEELRENRQKVVKAESYLKQIQEELLEDIQEITRLEKSYKAKDSLIALIMTDQLTKKDYIKNPALLIVIRNYIAPKIQTAGYENYLTNFEHIPEKYKPISKELNKC